MINVYSFLRGNIETILDNTNNAYKANALKRIVEYVNGIRNRDLYLIKLLTQIANSIEDQSENVIDTQCALAMELYDILLGGENKKGIVVLSDINSISGSLKSVCADEWHFISNNEINPEYIDGYDALLWCGSGDAQVVDEWGMYCDKENFIDYYMVCYHTFLVIPSAFDIDIYNESLLKEGDCRCIVTGMSYIRNAINTKYMQIRAINTASSSSDIFYDYLVFKDVIERCPSIDTVIIGLAPYSLRYDLSLARREYENSRLHYLADAYNNSHNSADYDSVRKYKTHKKNLCELFGPGILRETYKNIRDPRQIAILNHNVTVFNPNTLLPAEIDQMHGKYNKPYPNTVLENKELLKEYISYASDRKMNIYLFLPPYSSWYKQHWNIQYKNELLDYISELKDLYNFKVLDFSNEDLPDYMFGDYAHTNNIGAIYVTERINEAIIASDVVR